MVSRELRVLVVGGWPATTFLTRLYVGLLERGVTVAVASSARPGSRWLERTGFEWVPTPPRGRRGWLRPALRLRAARAAHRLPASLAGRPDLQLCALARPDVLYFPWNSAAVDAAGLFEVGVPTVVSCRGRQINVAPWDPARAPLREGLGRTLGAATAVHCVSEAIRVEAVRWGLGQDGGVVIRPAVPVADAPPPSVTRRPDERLRLVSVGSLEWVKGLSDALQAVALLLSRGVDVSYEIIGGGDAEEQLRFDILDLGLEDAVTLSGPLPSHEVPARLAAAHVFLLPSLTEGIANAALEAMAHARPVISTRCGGMAEVIRDGENGLLVPPRDPAALADAVARLAANPDEANRFGRSGWEHVRAHHRIEDQVEAFERLFRDVVRGEAS